MKNTTAVFSNNGSAGARIATRRPGHEGVRQPSHPIRPDKQLHYETPEGYDAHHEHHRVFYEAVRSRRRPVEDAVFGFRAAGPALLANVSYFEKRVCSSNARAMAV